MLAETERRLLAGRVIAILRGDYRHSAEALVAALAAGGVRAVEVTMNSPGVLDIIARLVREFGDDILIGAGTVRTVAQVQSVADAGGRFIVAPDTHPPVIAAALAAERVPLPGALTPSEVTQAQRAGATLIKLFPAAHVSPAYVKAVLAPLGEAKLFPTGGITRDNAAAYLAAGAAGLGVGSALVPKTFDGTASAAAALTQQAAQFMQAIAGGTDAS